MGLNERETAIIELSHKMRERFEAIAQPRSDFALEQFVVAQHDTIERQWAQAVLELQGKVFAIERARLQVEEAELEIEEVEARVEGADAFGRRHLAIEIARQRMTLAEAELARLGAVREAETLYAIIQQLEEQNGGPFTYDLLQGAEARYWRLRLERQALTNLHTMGTPGAGEVEAILQLARPLGGDPVPRLSDEAFLGLAALARQQQPQLKEAGK